MLEKKKCLIIAEAGVNHNGNLDLALQLCDAAKIAGADIVKFQTWKTENIITKRVAQAEYQKENTGIEETQFQMLKRLELSQDEFRTIKKYCDSIGITFTSTADDVESLDFLVSLGIPFIKIGSGDIGNVSYLRYMGSKGLPIILSTGMSTVDDIKLSIDALRDGGAKDITLLHCTTSYPCRMTDVNLRAMLTMKSIFDLPVGYSDHTLGNSVATAAVALGASIIEKHFTLDKNLDGPDHKASSTTEEFKELVTEIRNIEDALGDGKKVPTEQERQISKVVLKRIVAKHTIFKNQVITEDDICVKRNDTGLMASEWDSVVGSKAEREYAMDEGIEISH